MSVMHLLSIWLGTNESLLTHILSPHSRQTKSDTNVHFQSRGVKTHPKIHIQILVVLV